jgi:hypothetical protein
MADSNVGILINKKRMKWYPWEARADIPYVKEPGVYLIARFRKAPEKVDIQDKNIVYIGESTKQTILVRLNTHNNYFSRRRGKYFISIKTFRKLDDPLRSAKIKYTERKLILDHVRLHGGIPEDNTL